ncbi:MAG: pirin family protein [Gammaproteobacteria bacterium]|nr:pirin family protein [Gammaproteobacteria bacterium]
MPEVTPDSIQVLATREAVVGGSLVIRRALPQKARRMVGAWCFLDHFGPAEIEPDSPGLRVGPHPHIGLQTVTWLHEGEVLHRDSLGSLQEIRPGQLNLMTSGAGITHSEESPGERGPRLHGLQFWIALPDGARHDAASFEHHAELPSRTLPNGKLTVVMGSHEDLASPASTHTPLVGMELQLARAGDVDLSLREDFEHALLVSEGALRIGELELVPGKLYYLPKAADRLRCEAEAGTRVFLLGGEPFGEAIVLWWNFVARSDQEIRAALAQWENGELGKVEGYDGPPLEAPALEHKLKAR